MCVGIVQRSASPLKPGKVRRRNHAMPELDLLNAGTENLTSTVDICEPLQPRVVPCVFDSSPVAMTTSQSDTRPSTGHRLRFVCPPHEGNDS